MAWQSGELGLLDEYFDTMMFRPSTVNGAHGFNFSIGAMELVVEEVAYSKLF